MSYEKYSTINEIDPLDHSITLKNQLAAISSFVGSGIWDPEYVRARNAYMLRGKRYKAIVAGIRATIIPDSSSWADAPDSRINFLDYLDYDELINLLFVNSGLKLFLDMLTYIATLKFACVDLFYNIFWRLYIKEKAKKVLFHRDKVIIQRTAVDDWKTSLTRRRRSNFYVYDE